MSLSAKLQERVVTTLITAVGRLPFAWLQRIGYVVGHTLAWFPNSQRRIARLNIRYCFPELSPQEQAALVHKSLRHTAMTIMEMLAFWSKSPQQLLKLVTREDTWPKAPADGRGMIFLLPHMGAWELFTTVAASLYPVVALYRPPKKAYLEALIHGARERSGMTLVPTTASGVKNLVQALREGKVLGMLPDQDPGENGGIFTPFFGQPAWTMTLVARLIVKHQTPVYFTYAERLGVGKGFSIHITPASAELYSDDINTVTAQINAQIERIARTCPEQYQWSYKRFKRQPNGAQSFYDWPENR